MGEEIKDESERNLREPVGTSAEPRQPLTQKEKLVRFAYGFFGWWLVNIPLGALLARGGIDEVTVICVLPVIFGINVLVLIIAGFRNRWIALGLLAAFALNLVISLVMRLTMNAICWVPFTTPLR